MVTRTIDIQNNRKNDDVPVINPMLDDKRGSYESTCLQMNIHPSEMTNSNSTSVLRGRAPSFHSIQQKRLKLIQEPSQLSSVHNDSGI